MGLSELVTFLGILSKSHQRVAINWIDVGVLAKQENLQHLLLENADVGVEGYITIATSLTEFLDARLFATENSVLRLKDKYYLFFSEDENPQDVLANEVLKLFPHHLFISAVKNSSNFTLWTQKFVGPEDNLKPILLDTYFENGHFQMGNELYPDKFQNLLGRTLEVASITYIPYVVSYIVDEGFGDVDNLDPNQPKKSVIYTGTEADIVLSFCQLRNCTLKVIPYGNDNWGGVYENGSSDGLIGSVYRHETEFGIGCYYNWFNDLFETSFAIAKSAVPILVPAPSRYPAFMTIILPFNKVIWSLIIVSIFVSGIVMHVIIYFNSYMEHLLRGNSNKFHFDQSSSYELTQFQMVALFFQQSFSQAKLDRFAARFFLSTLLLAAITLENTYCGQLKSLLLIPAVTEPVDTIQKFAKTSWKWATPSEAWLFSIASSDIPHEKIMTEKFVEMNYAELKDASYKGNYGIGLERLHGGTYSFGDYIKDGNLDQLIMTKDDLYYDYSRGFSRRGWPLMDTFNTHILWCLEHGLYNYWEKKHVYSFLDRKTQGRMFNLASGQLQKYPPIPLTVANITGPLYALAIGYGIAFIVLMVKIFIVAKRNKFTKDFTKNCPNFPNIQ